MRLCVFKWNHLTATIIKIHPIDPLELYSFRDLGTFLYTEKHKRQSQPGGSKSGTYNAGQCTHTQVGLTHSHANIANYFEFTIELITSYNTVYPGIPIPQKWVSQTTGSMLPVNSISRSLPATDLHLWHKFIFQSIWNSKMSRFLRFCLLRPFANHWMPHLHCPLWEPTGTFIWMLF